MENSRLGKLAAELRISIYELVLIQPKPISLLYTAKGLSRFPYNQQPQLLSLLSVCRQTQKECAGLFYSQNSFILPRTAVNGYEHSLKFFITAIGDQNASSLRKVTIRMNFIHKNAIYQPYGQVGRALREQLYSLETLSIAHPRLRVLCRINMRHNREHSDVEVELDMTDWKSSKKEARTKLEPSMRSEHQSPGEISTATCLIKILDEYESNREEN